MNLTNRFFKMDEWLHGHLSAKNHKRFVGWFCDYVDRRIMSEAEQAIEDFIASGQKAQRRKVEG